MFSKCIASLTVGTLALTALLSAVTPSHAQQQGWPINQPSGSSSFPWNSPGFRGYSEPPSATRLLDQSAPPSQPEKYQLYINALPEMKNTEDANVVTLVAHVPENAEIWIGDYSTTSKGTLRTYVSPQVTPGKEYTYSVRADWIEGGRKVTQTHTVPVSAGGMFCVYLLESSSKVEKTPAVVEANLSKLSAEDQEKARSQKFCAIQTGVRLGAMGTPAKVIVKGQPVFLCCEACIARAESKPDQTLAKVKDLREKRD